MANSDPLARREGESKRANIALRDYASLGISRSLDALHGQYLSRASTGRQPTLKRYTLGEWSRRYDWVARVAEHEAEQRRLADEAMASARQESAREMAERQTAQGRQLQGIARLLAERAEQYIRLLRIATVETIDEVGQVVRVVKTELSASEAANLLRASAALARVGIDVERMATGEATDRVDVRLLQQAIETAAREMDVPREDVAEVVDAWLRERRR